ncbi:1-acyl-sn-glycerol-3-phosphate acyltransferase [Deinococcus piscis]|uniref:1-acyl-sn-glycerol-3-phosphate acyltransferase n=1 Tax=Deinococcus piscis TaxID=394230 RepID=A0ABQ3JWP7_9DEIO|nr:lysophospholipid acyltransferase family protein [Deinococcus piscis]GHF93312.1 1-acyl-sn-glycerol-3-phosphate acyltransferase [Deinococcus piscis]
MTRPPGDFPWVAPMLRATIRRDLRRSLSGFWVRGTLPPGGAVLAANHGSWWDGYLLLHLGWEFGHPARIMMNAPELGRFPFLQRIGCTPPERKRELVRAAQTSEWVMIFPEGGLQAPGSPLAALHPGAAWLARSAHTPEKPVPLIPVALRVVLRAERTPAAFARFGVPCAPDNLSRALGHELAQLDADLRAADLYRPPEGYLALWRGQGAQQQQTPASRLLTRLTGDRL